VANEPLQDQLRRVYVFSELESDELARVGGRMLSVKFPAGSVLCRDGETADRLFLIASGSVDVLKGSPDGQDVTVATLGPGDTAGEMALFGGSPRSATLRATSDVDAWILDYAGFQRLLDEHPEIARALLAHLSQHLRRESSAIARLTSSEVQPGFRLAFFDTKPYIEDAFRAKNTGEIVIRFLEPRLSAETVSLASGSEGVCVFVNDELGAPIIDSLHALGVRLIALRCAGYNNVDIAACERHGISVTRVPAYSPHAVAEHAAALILSLNRSLHRAHGRVREGNFSLAGLVGFDMYGKTAGVVGAGKIGTALLRILHGFGCRLLAYEPFPREELTRDLGVEFVPLDRLLRESDIVSLHTPLTPETRHMIDARAIVRMKPHVMLINTSRGALVDTGALLDGLKSGQIGSAGLDVYEEESEYFFEDLSDRVILDDLLARLLTFPNVIVTSHQGFLTHEALGEIARTTLDNVREFAAGHRGTDLTNVVRPSA